MCELQQYETKSVQGGAERRTHCLPLLMPLQMWKA